MDYQFAFKNNKVNLKVVLSEDINGITIKC